MKDTLKQLRGNMSQTALSKKLGISQCHICHLESGRSYPSWEVLEMYCTYFKKGSVTDVIKKHLQ